MRPRYGVYGLLTFAFCMGIAGMLWSPDGEFFPFASFSLFSVVPNVRTAYAIELRSAHGQPPDPPRLWMPSYEPGNEPTSSEAFYTIQRFGAAYTAGRVADADYWRRLLEQDFLSPPVHYDLLRVRYDPFERLSTGELRQQEVLASFDAES
jgi:hypothetical protein